ncbi:cytochrome oxidase c subunit VIb-domain-containing protein [Trametes elegans]|nr:cytochrome oxidase c subunit VIb-domain-containing protein [Trametes elegans]
MDISSGEQSSTPPVIDQNCQRNSFLLTSNESPLTSSDSSPSSSVMGWFSGSKSAETPDPTSRQDRQRCWESRDAYFACLDAANVVKPGDEQNACADTKKTYEQSCAKSWIEYFNKRRVLAEQQQGVLTQARTQAETNRR